MIDFVLDHKWAFFIAGEFLFWVCIFGFLFSRYWFAWKKLSFAFIGFFLLSDLWLLFIGIMDYRRTGEMNSFQVIIFIVFIYALTSGKSQFKKLDGWMKRKVASLKGEELQEVIIDSKPLYGFPYALQEGKYFLSHALIYFLIFGSFLLFAKTAPLESIPNLYTRLFDETMFINQEINKIFKLWSFIIAIDFFITASYFVFPKQKA